MYVCAVAWHRFFDFLVGSIRIKLKSSWLIVADFVLEGFLSVLLHFPHERMLASFCFASQAVFVAVRLPVQNGKGTFLT